MAAPQPRLAVLTAAIFLSIPLAQAQPAAGRATTGTPSKAPVVLILLENHAYGQIIGSHSARYLNREFIPAGTLFTRYFAVAHPSLPNYLALTSGSRDGCRSDLCPTKVRAYNIFKQLGNRGLRWAAYASSMPRHCSRSDTRRYAMRHNPAVYYRDIYPKPCRSRDVSFPRRLPSRLADFTFVTPNICQDMHSCSVRTADKWLSAHVPAFLHRGATVVIAFDEGTSNKDGGGHVMCAEVGPGITAGTRNRTKLDHYGLLAGLESYFGLRRLQRAANHRAVPI